MSNTHEYVVFDRAKVDPALAMKWPVFEKAYPKWFQWSSARDFMVEWGLDESEIERVDEILARKTVRQTTAGTGYGFGFLDMLLCEKGLTECVISIKKGDYDYGDELVSCAGAGFLRGDLSLASLTAVYHLHASRVDPWVVLPPDVAQAVGAQPRPRPMLPGLPNFIPDCGNGLGISQARRAIEFLIRAWKESWPLHAEGQAPGDGRTIRSTDVAGRLVQALRKRKLSKPCIYRWYEC